MTTNNDVCRRIREFVFRQFPLAGKRGIGDDDSLLDNGIIDSLGVLDVVAFFEREFEVEISEDELLTDHFESVRIMAEFVETKLEEANLKETNLKETNLEEANLKETNLEETNLEEPKLKEIGTPWTT